MHLSFHNILFYVVGITVINQVCEAYEYLIDDDVKWIYDNGLYGHGFQKFIYNGDIDDYLPNSYRKTIFYPQIESYPTKYYVESVPDYNDQWNPDVPVYLTYQQPPRINEKPVNFVSSSSTESPPIKQGYHYPTPTKVYLPPTKIPLLHKKPETVYLPPTKKPEIPVTKTTTTTVKPTTSIPSTPQSVYLPPIIVPEPDNLYLPPRELSTKLQPPPKSSSKAIRFS